MKSRYCCDMRMKTLQVSGCDKAGMYTQTRYECRRCDRFDYGDRLYIPGTAPRGNKRPKDKDSGRRGPREVETA